MKSKLTCVLVMMFTLCGLGLAQQNGNNKSSVDVGASEYLQTAGGTMTGPIVGKATYPLKGSTLTEGVSITDVNGAAIGAGTLKGDLQVGYLSIPAGGFLWVDNSPPSGSASLNDNAGNSFGITAGKFTFGVRSGDPLPVYPNNAAAITGGLEHGDVYRTGADPDVIAIVH